MIPIAQSPLFHPQVLRSHRSKFAFPEDLWQRYQQFLPLLYQAQAHTDSLISLQAVHDLFSEVLGYRSPFIATDFWEIDCTDRVFLGYFNQDTFQPTAEIITGIFLPEIVTDRQESPEWLIGTDFYYIYLYHQSHSIHFYEYFSFADFTDLEALQAFYFLFCRRNFLGNPQSHKAARVNFFLEESLTQEQEVLRDFYLYLYRLELRFIKDFAYRLQLLTPHIPATAEELAKKLLYRLIFIAFQEAWGTFPQGLLTHAYYFEDPYFDRPVWENFRVIFRWIEKGNPKQEIPAISIPLFAEDPILDRSVHIGDELCRQMKEIERFPLQENVTPFMILFILEALTKNQSGLRRLQRWRFSKRFAHSHNTWNFLRSKLLENDDISALENPEFYWLSKWQRLQDWQLFDPDCSIGIRLLLGFDFLQRTYTSIAQILRGIDVTVEMPSAAQILQQIRGCDQDITAIEIVTLVFSLVIRSTHPPSIFQSPIDSMVEELTNTRANSELIDLSLTS